MSSDLLPFINNGAGHDNCIYLPTDIMCLVFNSSPPSSWMVHEWYLSCESCSRTHTHLNSLLLRSALFVFVYWVLSGLDNGEMGLLILSAHGAMMAHSSLALKGRPISSQLMQDVVLWGVEVYRKLSPASVMSHEDMVVVWSGLSEGHTHAKYSDGA